MPPLCVPIIISDTENVPEIFSAYERNVFAATKQHLLCSCGKSEFTSQGKGGKPNAGGFRTLQLQCHRTRGCGKKVRLDSALADSPNLKEEASIYSTSLEMAKKAAIYSNHAVQAIAPASKKRARESSPSTPSEDSVSLTPPPLQPSRDIDFLSDEPVSPMDEQFPTVENPMYGNFLLLQKDLRDFKQKMESKVESLQSELKETRLHNNSLIRWNSKLTDENKALKAQLAALQESQEDEAMSMVDTQPPAPLNQSTSQNKKMEPKTNTYAAVASKHRPTLPKSDLKARRAGIQLFKGPPKKDDISKLYIRLGDKRPIKNAKTAKEISQVVDAGLKAMRIKRYVLTYSKIGNSVLELYVEDQKREAVISRLRMEEIQILENFQPLAPALGREVQTELVVRRLAFLLKRYNSARFHKAILSGIPPEVIEKAKLKSSESNDTTQDLLDTNARSVIPGVSSAAENQKLMRRIAAHGERTPSENPEEITATSDKAHDTTDSDTEMDTTK